MRLIRLLLATAALVVSPAAPAVADRDTQSPADSVYQSAEFQVQAADNHLSAAQTRALQTRVDRVIARTGGTQVAINQVAWDGGDTLIPLPGEKRARELGVSPSAGTVNGCAYYQFCTYGESDFTGMVDRLQSCTYHVSHGYFVAYVNNQTPGTVATYYDYYGNFVGYSGSAFHKDDKAPYGHPTHYIKPC